MFFEEQLYEEQLRNIINLEISCFRTICVQQLLLPLNITMHFTLEPSMQNIDWLIAGLIDRLIDWWLIDRLMDWLIMYRLVDWLIDC